MVHAAIAPMTGVSATPRTSEPVPSLTALRARRERSSRLSLAKHTRVRLGRDLAHDVLRGHHHGALRQRLRVVDGRPVHGDAEEASDAVGAIPRVELLEVSTNRLFAVVDAERHLKTWVALGRVRGRAEVVRDAREHHAQVLSLVGFLKDPPALDGLERVEHAQHRERVVWTCFEKTRCVEARELRELKQSIRSHERRVVPRALHASAERGAELREVGHAELLGRATNMLAIEHRSQRDELREGHRRRVRRAVRRKPFEPRDHPRPSAEREHHALDVRAPVFGSHAELVEHVHDQLSRRAARRLREHRCRRGERGVSHRCADGELRGRGGEHPVVAVRHRPTRDPLVEIDREKPHDPQVRALARVVADRGAQDISMRPIHAEADEHGFGPRAHRARDDSRRSEER
jgi:hypothetical protein